MDSLTTVLPELSVAVAITFIWAGLAYKTFQIFTKLIMEKDKAYTEYVEANNHQSVEQMKEYTVALGEHTMVLKELSKDIKSLLRK